MEPEDDPPQPSPAEIAEDNIEIIEGESSSDEEFGEGVEVLYPLEEQNFHTDEVFSVGCNGAVTVSGGADHKAVVYDGEAVEIQYHMDSVVFVGFSACGKYLALGSMDTKVSVWSTGSWTTPLVVFDGPEGEVTWVAWHPKGPVLAAGSGDGSNWIWDVKAQSLMAVLYGHESSSGCGQFSPNGRYVVSGGQAPCVSAFQGVDEGSTVICLTMRDDNALILAGYSNGVLQGVSLTQPQPLFQLFLFEDSIESVGISLVMPWLATGAVTGGLKVVDVSSASVRCSIESPGVVKLIWRQTSLFVGFLDGTVREYEGSSLRLLKVFKASQSPVLDFTLSADRVIKGGEDGKVFVFSQTYEE